MVAQLSPILLGIQQALQALVQNQKTPTAFPAATVHHSPEPVGEDLAQGATANTDHFSVAQRPVSVDEDRTAFVTKVEVAALVCQEKEKISSTVAGLNLRPLFPVSITMKPYPAGYTVPNFQKFDGRKGNTIEHIARFVDAMRSYAHSPELCLREFSKSLTDRAYNWYLNLKPGSIQDCDHLVAFFKAKCFCCEARFTLAEPGRTRQHSDEDLDAYVKRFCGRVLDCSDAVDEETC